MPKSHKNRPPTYSAAVTSRAGLVAAKVEAKAVVAAVVVDGELVAGPTGVGTVTISSAPVAKATKKPTKKA